MRKHPRFAKSISGAAIIIGALAPFAAPASASGHPSQGSARRAVPHRTVTPHRRVKAARTTHVETPAGGVWQELRSCESQDNYHADSGNGYYGAYQFSLSTWHAIGGAGLPDDAPFSVQDALAHRLEAISGWRNWPGCSYALRLD